MPDDILYFSYGSNMDAAKMQERCPEAQYLGVGYLPDYQLVFTAHSDKRNRGGADILEKRGEHVWGVLYKLTAEDFRKLDGNKIFPEVYTKFQVTILMVNNGEEKPVKNVWTYALTDKSQSEHQPTNEYVAVLVGAARKYQFPRNYIAYLESFKAIA